MLFLKLEPICFHCVGNFWMNFSFNNNQTCALVLFMQHSVSTLQENTRENRTFFSLQLIRFELLGITVIEVKGFPGHLLSLKQTRHFLATQCPPPPQSFLNSLLGNPGQLFKRDFACEITQNCLNVCQFITMQETA